MRNTRNTVISDHLQRRAFSIAVLRCWYEIVYNLRSRDCLLSLNLLYVLRILFHMHCPALTISFSIVNINLWDCPAVCYFFFFFFLSLCLVANVVKILFLSCVVQFVHFLLKGQRVTKPSIHLFSSSIMLFFSHCQCLSKASHFLYITYL